MESLESDEQSLMVNAVEEISDTLNCDRNDQQSPKGNDMEEIPRANCEEEIRNVLSSKEGEDDGIPCVGMKFHSEHEAYNFYNEYASRIGFSIRKAKTRYNSSGILRQRNFYCSKQGLKSGHSAVEKADGLQTRTDCKASIRFAVTDGEWLVTHFNPDHNHSLADPEQRKFLRSNGRKLKASSLLTSLDIPDFEDHEEDEGDIIIPRIGMKVYSEEEAYNLYNKYATRIGFSIRKSKCHYNSKGDLRKRYYVCSKEGLKEDDESTGVKKMNTLPSRTNCKACIRFTVTDGVWEVSHFSSEHNHELVEHEQRKFLRSKRRISNAKAVSTWVRQMQTFSTLREDNGEADSVDFSLRDHHSTLHTEKLNKVEPGAVQSLMNYFKHKQLEDIMFFYMMQVTGNNCMTNFFWRDGRSRIDYDCFGDVVVFDTTFRIDRYNLVCAPFMGVNHHGKNVLFGCALLLDETISSFIWLFETFLESMGNRHPKTIFTNECQAMENAIKKVFPKSCHLLCLWNIRKNAEQHLSSLFKNPDFQKLFNKCLNGCQTVMEFRSTWDELIENYNLAENKWLKSLYDIRGKWCPAFSLDAFSANMRSTEKAENIYTTLCDMPLKTMNLSQILHQYEEATRRMRLVEFEEDFCCNQTSPARASKSSGMLMQAADVYTIEIFKLFQEEMVESLSIVMKELSSAGILQTYELTEEGQEVGHIVHFNCDSCTTACSCKMFESMGILCRHALRVLNMRSVTKIPAQYILKRWSKCARNGVGAPDQGGTPCNNAESPRTLLRRRLMHKAFCAVEKSLMTTRGSEIAEASLDQIIEHSESQTATLNVVGDANKGDSKTMYIDSTDDVNEEHCLHDDLVVSDSLDAIQKVATNARMKSRLAKKRKRKVSSSKVPCVQQELQATIVPSTTLFHPAQVPTFFHLSFYPSGVGTNADLNTFTSLHQGHFPTSVFSNLNLQSISMVQGTDQMPHTNQDSSTSPSDNHTLGQVPHLVQGNGSS